MDAGTVAGQAGGTAGAVPVDGTPGRVQLKRGGFAVVKPLKRSRMTRIFATVNRLCGGSQADQGAAGQMLVTELVVRSCVTALVDAKTGEGMPLVFRQEAFDISELIGSALSPAVYDELDNADVGAIAAEAMKAVSLDGEQVKN